MLSEESAEFLRIPSIFTVYEEKLKWEKLSEVTYVKCKEAHAIANQKFFAFFLSRKKVGDFNAQGPPVPIPNTVVKLCCADNT